MGANFIEAALSGSPVPAQHRLRFVTNEANRSAERHPWGVRAFGGHGMTELITQSIYGDRAGPVD